MLFHYILLGIVLGLAILCDPVAFVIYPAVLLWFLFRRKMNFFKMLLIILVSFIILTPWAIRNYIVHKAFVPVTTQFGVNFWIGNNPDATGTDYYRIDSFENGEYILMTQTLPPILLDSLNKLPEINRASFYLNQGIDFIKKSPSKFITLLIKKFYYYFWFAPPEVYSSKDLERYRVLSYIFYLPILIFGLIGIFLSIKDHKEVLFILFTLLFISGVYILTHVGLIRYRITLELYLLVFCAYFIKSLRR